METTSKQEAELKAAQARVVQLSAQLKETTEKWHSDLASSTAEMRVVEANRDPLGGFEAPVQTAAEKECVVLARQIEMLKEELEIEQKSNASLQTAVVKTRWEVSFDAARHALPLFTCRDGRG